jgi:hypothetical protein
MCAVVASVHAELEQSLGSVELIESEIVSQNKAYCFADDDPRKKMLNDVLSRLHLRDYRILLVKENSIRCYFICASEEHLIQLRRHFESGFMKTVMQDFFTLLAKRDEPVLIHSLQWDSKEYWQSMQQLVYLKALG